MKSTLNRLRRHGFSNQALARHLGTKVKTIRLYARTHPEKIGKPGAKRLYPIHQRALILLKRMPWDI